MAKRHIPTYHIKSIYELSPKSLKNLGVELLIVDLDNTLDNYKVPLPSENAINKIKDFQNEGIEVIMVSNNYNERVTNYANALGIVNYSFAMKPSPKKINQIIKEKNIDRNKVAIIGDQIFTDIEAGNRAHIISFFVDPLTPSDQPFTRFKRIFERPLVKRMRKKNLIREWSN